jgi:uncharacterized protein (UPF0548 family)
MHQIPTPRKPSPDVLRRFLDEQRALDFSYAEVGATASTPPAGYVFDRTRLEIGAGENTFCAACAALRGWKHFTLGWVEAWPTDTPLEAGAVVAVMGRAMGLWWLNACRIVYVIDERGDETKPAKFGYAYGTLPGHVESGEERFLIEWDREADRVTYEIVAFSKPHHTLTRLGYPFVRRAQKRFGRESAIALFRAVNLASALPRVIQSTG